MTDPDRRPDLEHDDPRPWERPEAVRRDCEPHRGGLLQALGVASLAFAALGQFAGLTALLGLPLGWPSGWPPAATWPRWAPG